MATYKAHCLTIHPDGVSAVYLPDITSQGVDLKPEMLAEMVAHANTPQHVAMVAVKPQCEFQTFSIAALLAAIGVKGLGIVTATNPGVTLYFRKYDDNGDPASGSVNRSYAIKGGVIVPKSLTCEHGKDAQLTVAIVPVKYSSNATIVVADNAALPTITVASLRWTLGPITVGGIVLTEYSGLEIDFGNNVDTRGSQSDVYDTHIDQRTHAPKITIKGITPSWFAASGAIPIGGAAATHAGDSIYLRKRTQDGTHFVANGTAEHIKFNVGGLVAVDGAAKGEAQRISETSLMLTLATDSSGNQPLVVNTASAIS